MQGQGLKCKSHNRSSAVGIFQLYFLKLCRIHFDLNKIIISSNEHMLNGQSEKKMKETLTNENGKTTRGIFFQKLSPYLHYYGLAIQM